ncbi:MAG: hypothetical protein V8Q39_05820 [Anaerovoracaceae bacterium]
MVSQAIAAMQMEADIHSPSKKTKNLVGIPMGEGVVIGFDTVMKTASKDVAAAISYPFDRVTKMIYTMPLRLRSTAWPQRDLRRLQCRRL